MENNSHLPKIGGYFECKGLLNFLLISYFANKNLAPGSWNFLAMKSLGKISELQVLELIIMSFKANLYTFL